MTSKADRRSVATKRSVSPRSKTSRTLPERSFAMPGRSSEIMKKTSNAQASSARLRRARHPTSNAELKRVLDAAWRTLHVPRHGRAGDQTSSADFAWARLGVLGRSTEGFRQPGGRRCDFAQGRKRPADRERDLQ